jgi:hypothetical protein
MRNASEAWQASDNIRRESAEEDPAEWEKARVEYEERNRAELWNAVDEAIRYSVLNGVMRASLEAIVPEEYRHGELVVLPLYKTLKAELEGLGYHVAIDENVVGEQWKNDRGNCKPHIWLTLDWSSCQTERVTEVGPEPDAQDTDAIPRPS